MKYSTASLIRQLIIGKITLMRVSKLKQTNLNICCNVLQHNSSHVVVCYEQKNIYCVFYGNYYVVFNRFRTLGFHPEVYRQQSSKVDNFDGFVANLFGNISAKNYQNRAKFDKVITKA